MSWFDMRDEQQLLPAVYQAYADVQEIARATISFFMTVCVPGMNLMEVRQICEERMRSLGADSFWYYDIGAFVFSGKETGISVSGRDYQTADTTIAVDDIITIDLSPQKDHIWGDYARTIIIEDGRVIEDVSLVKNTEWRQGLLMERSLHERLVKFATPDMSFEELHAVMNQYILDSGFINLDYLGNLGHSIATEKKDRVYIERGNTASLSSVPCFTFEPHLGLPGSDYGYKHENIYAFNGNRLIEL